MHRTAPYSKELPTQNEEDMMTWETPVWEDASSCPVGQRWKMWKMLLPGDRKERRGQEMANSPSSSTQKKDAIHNPSSKKFSTKC
jgi:hypothetical protein